MNEAPRISKPVLTFFRSIVRGYFARHFRAVRISHGERFRDQPGPLIVYANHSSWWDPMVSVLLAAERMPQRDHYAPMDAAALARYGILKRVGIFPVAIDSARGAAQFLRTSLTVLASGGVLWVTPQGRFADVRERPLQFKPGLASLATRVPGGCTLLPLAIEYTFWDERMPETLLHFGTPIPIDGGDSSAAQQRLEAALLQTMDELSNLAIARDPRNFELLQSGRAGTGGFYAFFQRLWAIVRGKPYQADHTPHAVHTPAVSRPGAGE